MQNVRKSRAEEESANESKTSISEGSQDKVSTKEQIETWTSTKANSKRWLVRGSGGTKTSSSPKETSAAANCAACRRETLYNTEEEALQHLRQSHGLDSSANQISLKDQVYTVKTFAKENQIAEYILTLRLFRDHMLRILLLANAIQDGVSTSSTELLVPVQGLPRGILEAFESMVLFMCATRFALENITWFFEEEIFLKEELSSLVEKQKAHQDILSAFGEYVQSRMREAEQQIISSISSRTETNSSENAVEQASLVGPHYIALRMVCSLLEQPICNGLSVSELYENYLRMEVCYSLRSLH